MSCWRLSLHLLLLTAPLLATPLAALAGDGVIEINMASAAAGGITPGDAPGFPVTLSLPGSYRLSGDLTTLVPTHDMIVITSPNVTLDLAGHEIAGPTQCTPFPCVNTGGGRAIGAFVDNVSVSNGTVRGMGGFGIELVGDACRIERVHIVSTGGNGIQAYCGAGQILHNVVEASGDNGIHLVQGIVADNVVLGSQSTGIYIDGNVLALRNTSSGNGQHGIYDGGNSAVFGNTVIANAGGGLSLGGNTGYGQNVISGNTSFQVSGGAQVGGNVCNGSAC